ncbi:MAG: hypothetical protein P8X70_00465 [Nanoarchaeota archaeon]
MESKFDQKTKDLSEEEAFKNSKFYFEIAKFFFQSALSSKYNFIQEINIKNTIHNLSYSLSLIYSYLNETKLK